eukprot:625404-Alexandrium_andersonii.AAC.1
MHELWCHAGTATARSPCADRSEAIVAQFGAKMRPKDEGPTASSRNIVCEVVSSMSDAACVDKMPFG